MNEYLPMALALLWFASGFASFVFWWTAKYDFTKKELFVALYSSLLGPINFAVFWFVFRKSSGNPNLIFVKKRNKP